MLFIWTVIVCYPRKANGYIFTQSLTCWLIANCIIKNDNKTDVIRSTKSIKKEYKEYVYENVICKISAISFNVNSTRRCPITGINDLNSIVVRLLSRITSVNVEIIVAKNKPHCINGGFIRPKAHAHDKWFRARWFCHYPFTLARHTIVAMVLFIMNKQCISLFIARYDKCRLLKIPAQFFIKCHWIWWLPYFPIILVMPRQCNQRNATHFWSVA